MATPSASAPLPAATTTPAPLVLPDVTLPPLLEPEDESAFYASPGFLEELQEAAQANQQEDALNQEGRLPPQNLDAEQALLGACLIAPDVMLRIVEVVKPAHFYRPSHHKVFEAICHLFDSAEPIDIITVSEHLSAQGHLEKVGGRGYINDLALSVLSTDNVERYARIIRDKALLRSLIKAGSEVVGEAYTAPNAELAIDKAQQAIFAVAQQGLASDFAHVQDILPTTFAQIEERNQNKGSLMGVATGFYDLDNYLSGLQPADLLILAARPSMGKTAFCLNILNNVALQEGKPVLFFSLEMSKEQLVQRMLCSEAMIDAQRIRTGEINEQDFAKLAEAMGRLGDAPIYIDDTPSMSVMDMRAKARKLLMEQPNGIGLIIIDYLQLMEGRTGSGGGGGGENRQNEIAAISRGLKGLARELKCPVMALSQLSRAVESRQDKKPMLSDLRESGSIEQDADVVMFIYRDEYYNPETDRPGMADIIIAKQRNGPVGTVSLIFRNNITRFMNPYDVKQSVF